MEPNAFLVYFLTVCLFGGVFGESPTGEISIVYLANAQLIRYGSSGGKSSRLVSSHCLINIILQG